MKHPDPPAPTVSYVKFSNFAAANGPTRVHVARGIADMQAGPYQLAKDYYRGIRGAIVYGTRANSPTVLEAKLALAVNNAAPARKIRYSRIADAWLRQHRELGLGEATVTRIAARTWPEAPFVRVNPSFVVTDATGRCTIVALHLHADPLRQATAAAMLRLMQLSYGDLPDLTPVVVDVQHGRIQTPQQSPDADFDTWLSSEAAGLEGLLHRLRDTA